MRIYNNILETIGKTPIVKLNKLAPKDINLYVKIESFNPGGSVKDRLALSVILDAEKKGLLKPGNTIIECTSGNVGIALAMVSAARGYNFIAVMGDNYSIERRKIIKAYGGKVILFPSEKGSSGGNKIADEYAIKYGWFRPRQFENQANPEYHKMTTASEILGDFAGKNLDYFITGSGTGGTLTGVGQMLRVARPDVNIIVAEPENASIISGNPWAVHEIQGWTPDFIPPVLDTNVIDEIVTVNHFEARKVAHRLAKEEGILVGISAGATVSAALKVASKVESGSTLLAMLPDTGERYLSSFLFENITEKSDNEWLCDLDNYVI